MNAVLFNALKATGTITLAGGAVFALSFLPDFKMVPLRRWRLPVDLLFYVPSLTGIGISMLIPKKQTSNRKRAIYISLSVALSLFMFALYSQLSESPPIQDNVKIWSIGCFISYAFSYLFLGYGLTQLGKIIVSIPKPTNTTIIKKRQN
jgi:hypothetical protein